VFATKPTSALLIAALVAALCGCEAGSPGASGDELLRMDGAARAANVAAWPLLGSLVSHYAEWVNAAVAAEPPAAAQLMPVAYQPAGPARVLSSRRVELDATLGAAAARSYVDVVRFAGRVYLGVRSLPGGGSGGAPRVDIVSSEDETAWRGETHFVSAGEPFAPRFLQWGDKLFSYVSELSGAGSQLKPKAVWASVMSNGGLWEDFRPLALDGQVVWRAKMERGVPLITSYALADKTYEFDEASLEVHLLTSDDGFAWHPFQAGRKAVYRGGGSEAAFSSDDDGNLYSVVRNEAGDQSGFGSSICAAPSSDWGNWDCVNDPKKYDSPVLFSDAGELYLLARRHLTESGRYDTGKSLSLLRRVANEAADLAAPKRCALWHLDRAGQRVEFMLDLPSRGNTCSPAVMPGENPGEFVVYDHSSDVNGPDLSLRDGLAGPTFIYRHVIALR
jgi:hypothetical protein